jgi:beta-glucanase (GH16 family)
MTFPATKPLSQCLLLTVAAFCFLFGAPHSSNAQTKTTPYPAFSKEGLVLWLDASDVATVVKDDSGRIISWKDKSGQGHDATNINGNSKPALVAGGMNGKPVIRFGGSDYFEVSQIRDTPGKLAIFIVTQRLSSKPSDLEWQRMISSSDGTRDNDNKSPNFNICGLKNGKATPYEPTVVSVFDSGVKISPISIGRNQHTKGNYFSGDIAEILIFDREFVSEDAIDIVIRYLTSKWNAKSTRTQEGWTLNGDFGPVPTRKNDLYPLSDQDNAGKWTLLETMSDEFNGDKLDASKWWDCNPAWKGRQPGLFLPHNVEVRDGKLRLTMRSEEVKDAPDGYHTFTAAAIQSKLRLRYGYYEIRAKPMRSAGSSAFWLYYHDPQDHTEIDIFEIGGGAPGFERKDNMNLHVFRTPTETRHWGTGAAWTSPWDLAGDFHVYGFEWDEKELKYFVDGVLVRRVNNLAWNQPLTVNFDTETMPSWFGLPDAKDLPSTFEIDYFRIWRKPGQTETPLPGFGSASH